jgi:GDP-L-fucose synthase
MIRKFHLAKLAAAGETAAITRDEAAYGPIPSDIRAALPEVILWGTGTPLREFLFVDDLADACVFLMNQPDAVLSAHLPAPLFNIGVGSDLTISDLAAIVARAVGFTGRITFDPAMPDGTPRKLLDTTRMRTLGWRARTTLEDGIKRAYEDYQARYKV